MSRMAASIAPMGTKVRPVRFQSGLMEELEERLHRDGEDLSYFINARGSAHAQAGGGVRPRRRRG